MFINNVKKLFKNRELLFNITLRQIKVRYKQSVLGISWAILRPLSMMAIFTVVFSKFAKVPTDGIPYPIFSYCALLPWTFFTASLNAGVSSMVANSNLIKQIYFPREIFPISSILAGLFDFIIASVIFIGMMVFYKIELTPAALYVFPLLLIMIVFSLVLSLFLSAFNVYYRDVGHAVPFLLQLLMFAAPVVYSVSSVPEKYRFVYMLNPLAVIIDGFRRTVILGMAPDKIFTLTAVVSVSVMFIFSYWYFKKVEMKFADIV